MGGRWSAGGNRTVVDWMDGKWEEKRDGKDGIVEGKKGRKEVHGEEINEKKKEKDRQNVKKERGGGSKKKERSEN